MRRPRRCSHRVGRERRARRRCAQLRRPRDVARCRAVFADEDETRGPLQMRQRSFDEGISVALVPTSGLSPARVRIAIRFPRSCLQPRREPGHPQQSRRDQVPYRPTDPGMQCHTAGHQTALPQNPFTNGVTLALVGVEHVVAGRRRGPRRVSTPGWRRPVSRCSCPARPSANARVRRRPRETHGRAGIRPPGARRSGTATTSRPRARRDRVPSRG